MTKKKNTSKKTVEATVTKTVETPTAIKPKSNTFGIKNLNIGSKKVKNKSIMYQLLHNGGKDRRGKTIYPVVYMVKSEDIIFDAEKDVNRRIRYIPGEPSIFEDEQKKESKVKSPITFSNGFLLVDQTNPTLRKYLDMCNANADNVNRSGSSAPIFKAVDGAKDAKEKMAKDMKQMDALRVVFDMELDKLIGYATVMGVNINKSTDEIRYDMKIMAEKDPVKFLAGLDDPKMEIKQVALRAKQFKILDWDSGKVMWIQGDQRPVITHVPLGVKPLDCLADLCMTDKGSGLLDQMISKLSNFN